MSKDADHGALVSVAIHVQAAPPAGLKAKATCVAPEPETVALRATVPEIVAPGFVSTTVGAVTSTSTVIVAPVNVFPARSVITGRRS